MGSVSYPLGGNVQHKVIELVSPGEPLPKSKHPDLPSAPAPDNSPVECGYVVAVREDGTLFFEVIGLRPGAIELLGLHKVAGQYLESHICTNVNNKEVKGTIS